jgi:hypothetical protein
MHAAHFTWRNAACCVYMYVNRRVQQLDLRAAIPLSSLSHYYFPANNRAATMSTWCFMRANERGHAHGKKGIKTNLQIRQPQMLIICRRYKGVNKLMTKRQLPALMASA